METIGEPLPGGVIQALVLLDEKGKAYGDSWRKRGEMFSILPNIARKVDRIGVPGAGDTLQDTIVDLLNYCLLYACWLSGDEDAKGTDQMAVSIWEDSPAEMEKVRAAGLDMSPAGVDAYVTEYFESILAFYSFNTVEERLAKIRHIAAILMHDSRI
nr:MAG TPA: Nucleotide modification associated domain 1 [Caudoviricetes sp.]